MGCGCGKIRSKDPEKRTIYDFTIELAIKEERTYIVYAYEDKIHFDALTCWEKGGKIGELRGFIIP